MAATNQRTKNLKQPPRKGRKRPRAVKKGHSGAGHTTSPLTNRRAFTDVGNSSKKGDPFKKTSLFTSSAGHGPYMQTQKGAGFKTRAKGKHRLRPRQGKQADMVR